MYWTRTGMGRLGDDGFNPLIEGPTYDPTNPATWHADDGGFFEPGVGDSYLGGDGPQEPLDVLTINAAPTSADELKNLIKNSGGAIVVAQNDLRLLVASQHGWQFSISRQADGQYKIVSSDYSSYLLIGGLALAAIVGITLMSR